MTTTCVESGKLTRQEDRLNVNNKVQKATYQGLQVRLILEEGVQLLSLRSRANGRRWAADIMKASKNLAHPTENKQITTITK